MLLVQFVAITKIKAFVKFAKVIIFYDSSFATYLKVNAVDYLLYDINAIEFGNSQDLCSHCILVCGKFFCWISKRGILQTR